MTMDIVDFDKYRDLKRAIAFIRALTVATMLNNVLRNKLSL